MEKNTLGALFLWQIYFTFVFMYIEKFISIHFVSYRFFSYIISEARIHFELWSFT